MIPLTIERPLPYLLPDGPLRIALVGCGGTGSHIAQSLARLAAHSRDIGQVVELCFIDGDRVERKNVGRQLFCAAEVGQNKAQTLAARFSAAFGLQIIAVPQMAAENLLWEIWRGKTGMGILVGAVDSADGRKVMKEAMPALSPWQLWLDCGNHEHAGQVVVGSATTRKQLHGCIKFGGIVSALPAPSLVYPDLLKPRPVRAREDCAAAMEDNRQSLMVNQMVAAVAGEYLYKLIVERRITTFETVFDLGSLAMRSTPITPSNLADAARLPLALLTGQPGERTPQERRAA